MLQVQEVSAHGIGQKVEQTKDTGGNVGASGPVEDTGPGGQLADEGDEVEGSCQSGVDQLLGGNEGGVVEFKRSTKNVS